MRQSSRYTRQMASQTIRDIMSGNDPGECVGNFNQWTVDHLTTGVPEDVINRMDHVLVELTGHGYKWWTIQSQY